MDLTIDVVTATTARLNFGGRLAGTDNIEIQLGPRPDFQFCVCPVFSIANAANYVANGLNQSQSYYVRAREVDGGVQGTWTPVSGFRTAQAAAQDLSVPAIVIDTAIIMRPLPILSWAAGNAVDGFPAKNVSRDAPVAWRSIAADGHHLLILEHAGGPFDTIAILNTNLPEATTMTAKSSMTAATIATGVALAADVPFRASPNLPGRLGYHGLIQLAAPVEFPFVGLYIDTPAGGTPAGLIHVEHVLVGLNRKSKNHALEKQETAAHLGSKERTRTGQPDSVEGMKMRRVEFDLAFLTETQSETLYQEVVTWLDEPVFVVPNSKRGPFFHDRMAYGDLKGGRTTQPTSVHYTRSFTVDSII